MLQLHIKNPALTVKKTALRQSWNFYISASADIAEVLKTITGVQQPHQSVVGFLIGKEAGEPLIHNEGFQT